MKTVIEMALEAGMEEGVAFTMQGKELVWEAEEEHLKRFAELVRADEREACAQLVDENADACNGPMGLVLRSNAQAIRAREKAK